MTTAALTPSMVLAKDNVYLPEGTGSAASKGLIGLGAILIVLTFVGGLTGNAQTAEIAMHAFQIGFLCVLGFCLSAMGMVMIFHQTNAGWSAAIRRQLENIMSLMWVPLALFVVATVMQFVFSSSKHAWLYGWMDSAHVAGDPIYEHKKGYLNPAFFYARAIIYFLLWMGLSMLLWGYSTRQDTDGDRWHTARARKLSSVGLIVFAFTTAFAGFDWLMSLDYHWFSTMLGVYFFAGNMISTLALFTLVLVVLRTFGRLHGAFTDEHLHDLGKLLFAFVVFWAYITYSQYFLIWYANIPEETAFFLKRKVGMWETISWVLPVGHFIVPFMWLIPRPGRRKFIHIAVACVWLLGMHFLDLFWMIRPEAAPAEAGVHWLDLVGALGPFFLFIGLLIRKVGAGPLIPLHDPRLPEAIEHRNFV